MLNRADRRSERSGSEGLEGVQGLCLRSIYREYPEINRFIDSDDDRVHVCNCWQNGLGGGLSPVDPIALSLFIPVSLSGFWMFLPVSFPISRVLRCPPRLAISLISPVVLVAGQFPALPLSFPCLLAFFPAAILLARMPCGYDKQSVTILALSSFHKDLLLTKAIGLCMKRLIYSNG